MSDAVAPRSPLATPLFRALWIATIVSNIGAWMHDVGAAWLMTSLAPDPLYVALIQAATRNAAQALGRDKDVGAIAVGRYGDLVAVAGDPLANVRLLEAPSAVVKGGKLIARGQ